MCFPPTHRCYYGNMLPTRRVNELTPQTNRLKTGNRWPTQHDVDQCDESVRVFNECCDKWLFVQIKYICEF